MTASGRRVWGMQGDLLLLAAGGFAVVNKALDRVRQYVAKELGMVESGEHALLWVTDFPMYEWKDEEQRLEVRSPEDSLKQHGRGLMESQRPLWRRRCTIPSPLPALTTWRAGATPGRPPHAHTTWCTTVARSGVSARSGGLFANPHTPQTPHAAAPTSANAEVCPNPAGAIILEPRVGGDGGGKAEMRNVTASQVAA